MLTASRLVTLLGVAAVVTVGSACESEGEPATNVVSPTASSPVATPPASPARDQALAAYRGMWAAFVEAARTSDPDAPDLRIYTSDNALRLTVNALYVNRDQGKVILGALALNPKVTVAEPETDPTTITIVDCVNSETWLEYWAAGGLVDDKPGGKHHTTATVAKTPEGWKVSAFNLRELDTC